MESFVAGFAYGATTVCVGQPLDTLKTLQQASLLSSSLNPHDKHYAKQPKSMTLLARELYQGGGVRAFYRGGLPLLLGGGLMRSAQFGVYQTVLSWNSPPPSSSSSNTKRTSMVNPHVVVAGFCGGIGRGLVEGPFEMVKVRRQVVTPWTVSEIGKGFGTTLVRNAFLFASFAVYMDIYDHYSLFGNDGNPAAGSPFLKGGICANLAWLTIWPLDVVKSRLQSGHYPGKSPWTILRDAIRDGHLYRGLVPGLTRSFIANGCSMVVYKHVERSLLDRSHKK